MSSRQDIIDHLARAAAALGADADTVLRRMLHLGPHSMSAHFFPDASEKVRTLVDQLDAEIGVRNPALHYVDRAMYVGFRREEIPRRSAGARSQVFASVRVVAREECVQVLLPLDPKSVTLANNMRDLSGLGHHGVGDLEVTIRNTADIDAMFIEFGDWLTSR